ncbi:MAG: hypothetical protein N3B15_07095 [Planctomycetota bacterium]|nr:hypothetical protein [Planctomycetota bacterium]
MIVRLAIACVWLVGSVLAAAEGALRWEGSERRHVPALVVLAVVADTYEAEPQAWNLPGARACSERFLSALRSVAGLEEQMIRVLSGRDVHHRAIASAIEGWSQLEPGRPLTALIYWIGHGWTQDGQLRLMTHFTRQERSADGQGLARWQETIAVSELHGWLNQLATIRERQGGSLEAACIYQVCRPQVLLPPDPVPVLESDRVWQLFAVPAGRFAPAPALDGSDDFVLAWSEVLRRLAELHRGVRLVDIHRELVAQMRARQREAPELTRPRQAAVANGPLLLPPQRISFELGVVDALAPGSPVAQAEINLSGRSQALSSGTALLEEVPTGDKHRLVVSAAGYVTLSQELALTRAHHGRRLIVALLPASWIVRGRIDGLAEIEARGELGRLRQGVHSARASTDALGNFELRLPLDAGSVRLAFQRGGVTVSEVPLSAPLAADADAYGNRVLDLGQVFVQQAGFSDRLDRLAQAAIRDPDDWRFVPSAVRRVTEEGAPTLPREKAELWQMAQQAVQQQHYELALARLRAIWLGSSGPTKDLLARWLAWVWVQLYCQREAAAIFAKVEAAREDGDYAPRALASLGMARALAQLDHLSEVGLQDAAQLRTIVGLLQALAQREQQYRELLESAVHQTCVQQRYALAARTLRRLVAAERHGDVILLARACIGIRWSDPAWQEARDQAAQRAARVLIQRASRLAIESNSEAVWQAYDRLVERLSPWQAAIKDELAETAAERLPVAARRHWQESRTALAAGARGWARAFKALCEADAAGLTPRYQRQADAERRQLALELYLLAEAEASHEEALAYRLPAGPQREQQIGRAIARIAAARAWWPDACDRLAAWAALLPQHPHIIAYRRQYEAADARWRQLREHLPQLGNNPQLRLQLSQELPKLADPERWLVRSYLACLDAYDAVCKVDSLSAYRSWATIYSWHPLLAAVKDRAWRRARQLDTAEAYAQFVEAFPADERCAAARQRWAALLAQELRQALPADPGPRPLRCEIEHQRRERRSIAWAIDAEGQRLRLAEAPWSHRGAVYEPESARAALQAAWQRHLENWQKEAAKARQQLEAFPRRRLDELMALDAAQGREIAAVVELLEQRLGEQR